MSGSDDGRGNSEEREGGPPARVLAGGQIVQPGQVDRLDVLRHCEREIVRALKTTGSTQVTHADRFEIATDHVVVKVWTVDAYERERGAVSSWPSARNVIEAVREGQLGLDALREVVTILDIHLGGQPEPSAPWPAWADHMRPGGQS